MNFFINKVRIRTGVLAFLFLAGIPSVWSQVTVDAKIDSLELLVGEQTGVTVDVSCDAGARLEWPALKSGSMVVPGVEVVDVLPVDTQKLNDGKRWLLSQKYIITSFDSALYYLPPFVVRVDSVPYESKSLALNVLTVPVDTLHTDRFFGPKDIMDLPFSWKEDWADIFNLSLLLLLLMIVGIYLYVRYRDNKPIIKIVKIAPKLPPHKQAMQEIEQIKAEKAWAREDSKEYYTRLTDTLRNYIRQRYGFNALEMTSTEIIERLMQNNDEVALDELRSLFATADLVKFAKYVTQINENDMNLVNAIDFINQTKVEVDPNQKPEPEEVTVEEKRSRRSILILRILLVVLLLASLGLLGWISWMVYKVVY